MRFSPLPALTGLLGHGFADGALAGGPLPSGAGWLELL
jgi:hypothetical protein